MSDDFDPDTFDPDSFDDAAFQPPTQDGGLAQAEALAAEVRKGASSMVAVAGRIEATLIAFEERATARDKAIMQRVVDPEALNQQAALGAAQGASKAVGGKLDPLIASIDARNASEERKRDDWMSKANQAASELRQSAFAVANHWENRRAVGQLLAFALLCGFLVGAGGMIWLNRLATSEAYQRGVADNRTYMLENPDTLKRLKAEYERAKVEAAKAAKR